ncbi:MAG: undecaprenyldiphospho-muramoylpentapeptide beta-N-acetylglucosaminyltransferase [Candidatus Sungbacteria bacterium RIFCSPLOWO2_02_FULL_51_17]|uniref:UDP-N-acetylglucosamine--N-acetylmuramyl-(pentapeptide) pyrophosphoryl-undecaprenol N-acetylglucosamine transferase n=1 Tax=Candidatus Sungbacteria bacterium RIFCSPHIGHO2_02_FULL_51_29 TaxID=1802273 RepID=A0A1G2KRY4_9BACT|nr:MAG: undecaprenyldiphospho-muramoylpentapeptide beta-N-acetylglucosaminyltransferase [Candidatus Sungbacteria bacterium RIFCSPHIGHO2_01_FULL_51_22]OHA02207.1 MAG: undecaprenyldiphospho-muramoylpentapeptide beta-N-acetylglucosaminyltransferase [Candidatus Sungbacteria bacterium RIFCSPHIGHO2_02_FULL_51_29]OHA10753.1 MAG: undecaprenyldiphospho-muramoylpentapeptide beta-N-acetylglucosaminyltransferase [Candidatus Sungbacteria bacterium RIFCSPLOWO2_02_FULL_51_17]
MCVVASRMPLCAPHPNSTPFMRILFTGGGTGGHFYPIIAVARELRKLAEEERILDLQLFYIGPDDFGREDLIKDNIIYYRVFSGKLRHYFSPMNALDSLFILLGILQAAIKLLALMPDVIFSKGGYGSIPVLFVAHLYRIPVIIHESDTIPGKVNRWSSKFARRIAVSFDSSAAFFPKGRVALTGNPVRKRIFGGNIEEAKTDLNILTENPVILITGGSQGAEKINNAVLEVLPNLLEHYEIIHQAGEKKFEDATIQANATLSSADKTRYHLYPFLRESQLRQAYAVSHLVIARAGSGSIFEIAAMGKPSILIPLKNAAQDHQRKNAFEYAKAGAADVVEEDNLSPHILLAEVEKLFRNPAKMKAMGEAAQKFARIDAAEVIAREILHIGLH